MSVDTIIGVAQTAEHDIEPDIDVSPEKRAENIINTYYNLLSVVDEHLVFIGSHPLTHNDRAKRDRKHDSQINLVFDLLIGDADKVSTSEIVAYELFNRDTDEREQFLGAMRSNLEGFGVKPTVEDEQMEAITVELLTAVEKLHQLMVPEISVTEG